MPSAIERDLAALLPTRSVLPPQLISLATSLLAQSKAAAPKLKPQEEIAREYACAHIACERLTNKLALDVAQIMPPCAPRVYNKLHRYLDGIITAGKGPVVTPKAKPSPVAASTAVKRTPLIDRTPSKARSNTPSSLKWKRVQPEQEEVEVALPEDMIKLGHHLCRTGGLPTALPHVFAGLERAYSEFEIVDPAKEIAQPLNKRARKLTTKAESLLPKSSKLRIEAARLPLIVVAIAHQTAAKMRTMESVPVNPDQELEMILSEALSSLRKQYNADRSLDAQPLDSLVLEVKQLTHSMQELSFWQEWLANVPMLDTEPTLEDDSTPYDTADSVLPSKAKAMQTPLRRKEKHGEQIDEDIVGAAGLLPGLGTMFQAAFDWLSDERCEDYTHWERDIRQQLATVTTNA